MHTNSIEDTNMENIITEIVGTMLILPNTYINTRNKLYLFNVNNRNKNDLNAIYTMANVEFFFLICAEKQFNR